MVTQPNLLLILTDQQHARMLGCAGNPHVRTPALDRLASEGIRFDRAYCTNPVCIPSRFSLMTGRMPSEIGMRNNSVANTPHTLPADLLDGGLGHCLRRAGYDTLYGGKVHLPNMSIEEVGFEYICQNERDDLAAQCAVVLEERPKDAGPFCMVASFINPHDICYMAIRDSQQSGEERHQGTHAYEELAALDAALARPDGMDEETFFATCCPPLPPNPSLRPEAL